MVKGKFTFIIIIIEWHVLGRT